VGKLIFWGIREPVPGPRWRQLLDATWSGYRGWYLGHGAGARPTLVTAADMLDRHMPELVPTWRRLVDLAAGDETAARFLTLYDPPRFLPGCTQVALVGDALALIRNYDYRPDLCERVVYSSAFTGRRVIGSGDCLWGLLDGMNDAGLAVSLTSVTGYPGPPGFGIPLVVRYLLETATTTREAIAAVSRLPVHMAYNLTLLDRHGDAATVFVAPGLEPHASAHRVATNHRDTVPDDPEHASSLSSVERQDTLFTLLERRPDPEAVIAAFLTEPLYTTEYARGFGTMYTAAYRPDLGFVDYVWPGSRWRRTFDSPDDTHLAVYRDGWAASP
jgi:predicted choloylglycine hydrolase